MIEQKTIPPAIMIGNQQNGTVVFKFWTVEFYTLKMSFNYPVDIKIKKTSYQKVLLWLDHPNAR